MVKIFTDDDFAVYVYEKHIEAIMNRFKHEKRFPCYSVGKLTSSCNRKNFYGIKDMLSGVTKEFDREGIVRMTMGAVIHDAFVLSDKAEWHLVYNDIYGHIDEYFEDAKILIEKKTTLDDIPGWKQTKAKGGQRFMYMPGEEWENQLRYYYLLIQKGHEVDTGKPANPDKINMVKRVYVLYYKADVDNLMQPYVVPVPMVGEKWNLDFIEAELLSKKEEIEMCLENGTVPQRRVNPNKCSYCPYILRCYYKDKTTDLPSSIKYALGKRSPLAKAQELRG